MTIIEKLSDRHNFIFDALRMIMVNTKDEDNKPKMMSVKELQWRLFQCGVYIKGPLLQQAISVMNEKGELTKPDAKPTKEPISENAPA